MIVGGRPMATLEQMLRGHLMSKPGIIAAYLFGSYARGKEQPSSDIDIAVLLDKKDHHAYRRIREGLLLELSRITRKDVDVIILNTANLILLRQVFAKGIHLVTNDRKKLAAFKMIAFSEMADFGYYRALMEPRFARKVLEG